MAAPSTPKPGRNWSEYAMEAGQTAWLMLAICVGVTFFQSPLLPVRAAIPNDTLRLFFVSIFMAVNIVSINYSYWGRRTGAHYNPAVTITFLRLGKIHALDAVGYVVGQIFGGLAGVALAWLFLQKALGLPPIDFVATTPHSTNVFPAFFAEWLCAFLLMAGILFCTNHPRLAPRTGALAGVFVLFANTLAAPVSGFSINPARWLASALPADLWTAAWIYVFAAPLAMLMAAEMFVLGRGWDKIFCAKLHHDFSHRCIFCEHHQTIVSPSDPARSAP